MKKFIEEFKAFAMRGNVLDMAVGVVIGGAFGKITTSLVNDIIMPVVSLLTNGIDFSQWKLVLQQAVVTAAGEVQTPEVAINFGNLIAVVLDFLIIETADRDPRPAEGGARCPRNDLTRRLRRRRAIPPPLR